MPLPTADLLCDITHNGAPALISELNDQLYRVIIADAVMAVNNGCQACTVLAEVK
jgi:hypothetical protein